MGIKFLRICQGPSAVSDSSGCSVRDEHLARDQPVVRAEAVGRAQVEGLVSELAMG